VVATLQCLGGLSCGKLTSLKLCAFDQIGAFDVLIEDANAAMHK